MQGRGRDNIKLAQFCACAGHPPAEQGRNIQPVAVFQCQNQTPPGPIVNNRRPATRPNGRSMCAGITGDPPEGIGINRNTTGVANRPCDEGNFPPACRAQAAVFRGFIATSRARGGVNKLCRQATDKAHPPFHSPRKHAISPVTIRRAVILELFDHRTRRIRSDRIKKSLTTPELGADFMLARAADGVADRLADIKRSFKNVAIIGAGPFEVPGANTLHLDGALDLPGVRLTAEEAPELPAHTLDAVISGMTLHRVNDPVGVLTQMRLALRPDGLLLAALFGGQTLHELRTSFAEAEAAVEGGMSPRVAPMAEIRDLGGVLQRAGFALPVADVDRFTVEYQTPFHLMRDLRAMGEANMMTARRKTFTRRETMMKMAEVYAANFATDSGRVGATFEIVYLTGWSPDASQQKPLRPGSARTRLSDALGVPEFPAGEKAGK